VSVLLRAARGQRLLSNLVVASPEATDRRYSLYRIDLSPRSGGARPHFHTCFAESFTVLSGEAALYDGARWVTAGEGDHLFVPERGVHGFRNDSDLPAAMLMMTTPGVRREDYFAELQEVFASGRELTPAAWEALYARHDQVMVDEG
jgi:mannose-6-phosphate isomerase-like protein (cupin superfamily)